MPIEGSMCHATSYINITCGQEIGGHLTIQQRTDIHFNFVTVSPFSGILLCKFYTATVFRRAVKVEDDDFNYRLPLCLFAQVWVMVCAEVFRRVLLGAQNFLLPSCFISVVPVVFEGTLLYCSHTSLQSEYFSFRVRVSTDIKRVSCSILFGASCGKTICALKTVWFKRQSCTVIRWVKLSSGYGNIILGWDERQEDCDRRSWYGLGSKRSKCIQRAYSEKLDRYVTDELKFVRYLNYFFLLTCLCDLMQTAVTAV